jgi:branched-subunit amino acid transport protein
MSAVWIVVLAVGAATVVLKAVGPVLLGGRALPAPLTGVVDLLAPALLAALVVTQVAAGEEYEVVADARLLGLAAAAVALLLRAPLLLVIVAAAAVTAAARALS